MNLRRTSTAQGQLVIFWSSLYLAGSWLAVLVDNLGDDTFSAILLFLASIFGVVANVGALFSTWRWLRQIIITSRFLDIANLGYRQGWAFWGWGTPFASLWIPRRLIERSNLIFNRYLDANTILVTSTWWSLWIISSIADYISFRLTTNDVNSFVPDLVSAICMSIAFPHWKKIVTDLSRSEDLADAKLKGEGNTFLQY